MEYANEGKEGVQQRRRRRRGESERAGFNAEQREELVGERVRKRRKTAAETGGVRKGREREEGGREGFFRCRRCCCCRPPPLKHRPHRREGGRAADRPAGTLSSFLERRCVGASVVVRDFRQWWGVGERGPHTCACHAAACLGLFTTLPPRAPGVVRVPVSYHMRMRHGTTSGKNPTWGSEEDLI